MSCTFRPAKGNSPQRQLEESNFYKIHQELDPIKLVNAVYLDSNRDRTSGFFYVDDWYNISTLYVG